MSYYKHQIKNIIILKWEVVIAGWASNIFNVKSIEKHEQEKFSKWKLEQHDSYISLSQIKYNIQLSSLDVLRQHNLSHGNYNHVE